jgi:hypothetical protein
VTLNNTFFVEKYPLSLQQISSRWVKNKPQMVEISGKDRGGLVHTSGEPEFINILLWLKN